IMAIQSHLRDPENFHYDLAATYPESPRSILDFLTVEKRGFCQQFASAMAVLLRELNIPARVATGFTTGDPVDDSPGTYIVKTSDLHAGVEVPFQGYGWLPFDPTPGNRMNPAAASYMLSKDNVVHCPPGDRGCGGITPPPPTPQKHVVCPKTGRGTL